MTILRVSAGIGFLVFAAWAAGCSKESWDDSGAAGSPPGGSTGNGGSAGHPISNTTGVAGSSTPPGGQRGDLAHPPTCPYVGGDSGSASGVAGWIGIGGVGGSFTPPRDGGWTGGVGGGTNSTGGTGGVGGWTSSTAGSGGGGPVIAASCTDLN